MLFVQTYEFLVKPLLNKCMGKPSVDFLIKLPLEKSYKRKKSDRKAFIPITISEKSTVIAAEYHGSAHIFSLPHAHGFAVINEGVIELKEGEMVDVRLF